MKRGKIFTVLAVTMLVGAALCTSAWADTTSQKQTQQQLQQQLQQQFQQPTGATGQQQQQQGVMTGSQTGFQALRVSEIIGDTVKDQKGGELGSVKDVIIGSNGQLQYLILSQDNGDNLTPIPFQAANIDMQNDVVTLANVDKQKLQNAPNFPDQDWNKLGQPGYSNQVFGYYGYQTPAGWQQQGWQQQGQPYGQGTYQQPESSQQSMDLQQQQQGAMPQTTEQMQQPGAMQQTAGPLYGQMGSQPLRASRLIGANVKSTGGEDLGTIKDLVLDTNGQARYLILSESGKDKLIPIPFRAVQLGAQPQGAESQVVTISIDKSRLTQAPNFSDQDWQKLGQSDFDNQVYGYYGKDKDREMQQRRQGE
jgi:sporulation protein YlmC with PRC-barrel domain